jgi:hypothetical protein
VHVVERALAEGYRAARVTCEAMAALAFLNWPGYTPAAVPQRGWLPGAGRANPAVPRSRWPGRADGATGRWAQILLDGLDRLPNVELVESRW